MLALVTIANAAGSDIVLHEDTNSSKRFLVSAEGLLGVGNLRDSKRVRPSAHGSINETSFEEGRSIHLIGEVWGTTIQKALEEMHAVSGVFLETLDNGAALLKWTEAATGLKLQMAVKLDAAVTPILQEGAGFIQWSTSLFAEDPRSYTQTSKTETGAGITGVTTEATFAKTTASYQGLAIDGTFIYFAGNKCIGRCKLAGTSIEPEWIKTEATPTAIVVDAGHIYWVANTGLGGVRIGRATIAGGTIENGWLFPSSIAEGGGLAIDAGHIYWGGGKGGVWTIGRATVAGGTKEENWIPTVSGVVGGLAVNASFIYYSLGGTIGRATIAGAEQNDSWITGASGSKGIAVSATLIYWANSTGNTIGRAKLAGTEVNQAFYSGLADPTGLAVNASNLFWNNTTTGYIGRSNLSGGPSGSGITVAQAGNRPTPLTFKINGPITDPSVVRESDGSRIALTGTISSGNYVEIDTADRTVKLNGTTNALALLNAQNTNWDAFAPLASAKYFLTATSATAAFIEAIYRSAYA